MNVSHHSGVDFVCVIKTDHYVIYVANSPLAASTPIVTTAVGCVTQFLLSSACFYLLLDQSDGIVRV